MYRNFIEIEPIDLPVASTGAEPQTWKDEMITTVSL
jgi:hypothetical protein